jgi:hypothetical protein
MGVAADSISLAVSCPTSLLVTYHNHVEVDLPRFVRHS